MTLAFLYPLAWLGALAVAAPVWLHLRRKADRSVIRFSAVQFLDDLPQARTSPLSLRDPLLFLLRLAALLALIGAFAWPYWAQERAAPASESRVYVLDNTLSRRAADGARLDRERLAAELRAAPADVQIAVVELTGLPRTAVDFRDSRAEAIAAVERLEPSYERGSLLAAFRQASALLAGALGERRRIVLFSDSQANQWDEASTVAPFLAGVEAVVPAPPAERLDNVAVFQPRARRLYQGDKSIVECELRVSRQGGPRSIPLAIEVNGKEVGRRTLEFTDESPPTAVVTFQWEAAPRERVTGVVRLLDLDDALDADDEAYFSLPELREGRVVAASRSPFLRAALAPEVMQGRWRTTWVDDVTAPEPKSRPAGGGATSDPSAGASTGTDAGAAASETGRRDGDVLIVESRFLLAPAGRELVDHYLARGRGVLLLIDQVAPPVQAYLRGHDVEFRSVVDQPTGAAAFRYVAGDHPIFQPFRSPDFGDLLEVRVSRYRRLATTRGAGLVYSQHGDMLLIETDRTEGKLLVAAFQFDRADTNWPLQPTFLPFLDLCLEYVRAKPALTSEFEPGERCVWTLPPDEHGDELTVRSGDEVLLRSAFDGDRVEFRAPVRPGSYDVSFDGGRTTTHGINVNANPLESALTYADATPTVAAWTLPDAGDRPAEADEGVELSKSEILRQTHWWWLLLVGATLLGAETIWSSRRSEP